MNTEHIDVGTKGSDAQLVEVFFHRVLLVALLDGAADRFARVSPIRRGDEP